MDAPQTRRSRFVAGNGRTPIRVSFEFFPPKTEEMEKTLWEAIARLAPASILRFRLSRSLSALAASGCISGNAATLISKSATRFSPATRSAAQR